MGRSAPAGPAATAAGAMRPADKADLPAERAARPDAARRHRPRLAQPPSAGGALTFFVSVSRASPFVEVGFFAFPWPFRPAAFLPSACPWCGPLPFVIAVLLSQSGCGSASFTSPKRKVCSRIVCSRREWGQELFSRPAPEVALLSAVFVR